MTSADSTSTNRFMQCMEVWGGNEIARRAVTMEGLDAWVYCEPFDGSDAGGDIYYVSSCATNRILRLLIADVSGHGEAVVAPAAILRGLMRQYVNHLDQQQFVRSMNAQFTRLAADGIFATAVVSTFFPPTGRLTLCNAGHPYPMLYRQRTRDWQLLRPSDEAEHKKTEAARKADNDGPANLPLGIVDFVDYRTFDVTLEAGDLVLCYTDSLTESRDSDNELLGHAGVIDLARTLTVGDPDQLVTDLLAAIKEKAGGKAMNDDVTMLLFRPNTLAQPRVSFRQQLRAGKLLTQSIWRRLRGGEPIPLPDLRIANLGGLMFPSLQKRWASRRRP